MSKLMTVDDFIETYSGMEVTFNDPQPEQIEIIDIAHALSNLCRYNGHVNSFYSVAEHSIICSLICDPEVALAALLHDSAEAYLGDFPAPVKRALPAAKDLENKLEEVIFTKFGLPYPMDARVKRADVIQLITEAQYLLPSQGKTWVPNYRERYGVTEQDVGIPPKCFIPQQAEALFLKRYKEITGETIPQMMLIDAAMEFGGTLH